jgi:lambda family phage portal protein
LPPGYELSKWDPQYPHEAMGTFLKACVRGVACGLGVAYHNLANDLEGVNYSSARIGELDERDSWMAIQNFIVEHWHDGDLYPDWLKLHILIGRLPFQINRMEKYRSVYWQGRRWAWVDPDKEVTAALKAIDGKIKSRTRTVGEGGDDIEDVFEEIANEEQLAKEKNIALPVTSTPKPGPQPVNEPGDKPDEEKPA